MPQYILLDNSALNYIAGQEQRAFKITDSDRQVLIDTVHASVVAAETVVVVNFAALGELAGLYFANRARFDLVRSFLFDAWDARVLRPTFDDQMQPLRIRLELIANGKAPMDQVLYSGKDWKHLRRAFAEGKSQELDRFERDAKARKSRFSTREKKERGEAQAELDAARQHWSAEFAGWENDPKAVVDEWTEFEMSRNRKFYGLPADRSQWPRPRDFVSLWHARGYVAARLRELFGEGRKCNDGGDLYDNMYFEDAAYADVLVTGDDGLARRGRCLGLTSLRILLTEDWVMATAAKAAR